MKLVVYSDGGCRNNADPDPGPASHAFVAFDEQGNYLASKNNVLPKGTNNMAEYRGLLLGIQGVQEILAKRPDLGITEVQFRLDAQLVVNQVQGSPVKKKHLFLHREKARLMLADVPVPYTIVHVPREQNKHADYLCNLALDGTLVEDLFAPLLVKPTLRGVSPGQLFKIGRLTEPRPLRVDIEGYALCTGCKSRLIGCTCPPLEEAA